MKKTSLIAILLGGLLISAFAHAKESDVTKAPKDVFNLGTLETTDVISNTVGKPEFKNFYNFTLSTGSTYDLVFDLNAQGTLSEKFATTPAFGFELFSNTLTSIADVNAATRVLGSNVGSFASNLSAKGLTSGSYTLYVFGKGKEDDSKYLTGSIGITTHAITVTPSVTLVPEPETYAMLLAGLGLMGVIARRRKAMQAQ